MGLSKYILLGQSTNVSINHGSSPGSSHWCNSIKTSDYFMSRTLVVLMIKQHLLTRMKSKITLKAQLQELTQSKGQGLPIYQLLDTDGPPHEPVFTVSVDINGETIAASTKSKSSRARSSQIGPTKKWHSVTNVRGSVIWAKGVDLIQCPLAVCIFWLI